MTTQGWVIGSGVGSSTAALRLVALAVGTALGLGAVLVAVTDGPLLAPLAGEWSGGALPHPAKIKPPAAHITRQSPLSMEAA